MIKEHKIEIGCCFKSYCDCECIARYRGEEQKSCFKNNKNCKFGVKSLNDFMKEIDKKFN